ALIGPLGVESTRQQIGRDRLVVLAHRRRAIPLAPPGDETIALHQPDHSLSADEHVVSPQLGVDARAAVGASTALVRLANEHAKATVLDGVQRRRPLAPGVVARSRNAQRAAQGLDRIFRLLRVEQSELHLLSFAKKAAA